jgi:tetratricopeptide (TPR) repeat protein
MADSHSRLGSQLAGGLYYREPVFLPKDSVIHMRYHYDNSAANPRNPNHPPKRVRAGNQATDEMGHLWLQILPRGAGDHRRELQEAVMRHRLEKNPNDVVAHMNLGAILLSRLDPQAAVTSCGGGAAGTEPPEVHNMLGLGLATLNRNADAIAQFEMAHCGRPDYASARFNLATALAKSGRIDEAIANLRQILAANPGRCLRLHYPALSANRSATGQWEKTLFMGETGRLRAVPR